MGEHDDPNLPGHGRYPPPPPPPPAYRTGPPAPGWWLASDGNWYPPQPGSGYGKRTNGLAVASLILGILWLYWIGSILALVFGYIARRQIDESQGTQDGRGMATAGIILGWVGVGLTAAAIGFVILVTLAASST